MSFGITPDAQLSMIAGLESLENTIQKQHCQMRSQKDQASDSLVNSINYQVDLPSGCEPKSLAPMGPAAPFGFCVW